MTGFSTLLTGAWERALREDNPLRRLFREFPRGLPGIALLLLRVVLGGAACLEGTSYLEAANPTVATWVTGTAAWLFGALLILGYLTPIACLAVLAGAIGVAFSIIPISPSNLVDTKSAFVFFMTILFGVLGLGPGALSLDARFFGRREIIVPPFSTSS
jgi:uncharacterized membrane protein YphA (DoxX/SURF4 family)